MKRRKTPNLKVGAAAGTEKKLELSGNQSEENVRQFPLKI